MEREVGSLGESLSLSRGGDDLERIAGFEARFRSSSEDFRSIEMKIARRCSHDFCASAALRPSGPS